MANAPFLKKTPLQNRPTIYSDFRKDLAQNPINQDLALKLNENAVNESLKNLILTNRGERKFQPELGGDINRMLFDNMTPVTVKIAEERVRTVINNHEPRVTLIGVEVIALYEQNALSVTIRYYLRNSETPISLNLVIERVR